MENLESLIEDNLNKDLKFNDRQRENSQEILEEISSVALLSPACINFQCGYTDGHWDYILWVYIDCNENT